MWIIASVESRTGKGEKNLDTWTPECILCALASCCALPLTILRLAHLDHSVTPRTRSWHIYIYNSKDRVLDYIYICNSKDKVLVYIYNSKDRVLDYICLVFKKKNVPVQDTACSADQLLFHACHGPGYGIYFQGQSPGIHL